MNVPERLGKYPVTRIIGEGAMGVVYEAFDPVIKRTIAIKTIRRELVQSSRTGEAAAARFRNEAQAAGRLAHPGIAGVYEYGEDQDCAYIVMEYVQGNSLREYLDRRAGFAEQDILSVMVQLLDALGYAHERQVWHRDIKPANLLVTRTGHLKITDFGIAKIEANGLTIDGSLLGTPGYMAPEQFAEGGIDHRVDIYASGALLYQLLAGRLPFAGSLEQIMYKTVTEDPLPPSSVEGAARWAHFDPIVARALARDPAVRFASAAEMRDALVQLSARPVPATLAEETLIMNPMRPEAGAPAVRSPATARTAVAGATALDASGPGRGTATTSVWPPPGWDAQTLAGIEARLTTLMGPVARVLVRRIASQCADVQTLRSRIAEHIPAEADRSAFLETTAAFVRPGDSSAEQTVVAARGGTAPGTRVGPAVRPGGDHADQALDEPTLALATQILAAHVGPIARVLARRAAAQAGTVEPFIARLIELAGEGVDARRLGAELGRIRKPR